MTNREISNINTKCRRDEVRQISAHGSTQDMTLDSSNVNTEAGLQEILPNGLLANSHMHHLNNISLIIMVIIMVENYYGNTKL